MANAKKTRTSRKRRAPVPAPNIVEVPELTAEPTAEPASFLLPYLEGMDPQKALVWRDVGERFRTLLMTEHSRYCDSASETDFHRALVLFFWRQSLTTSPAKMANILANYFVRNERGLRL